MAMANNAGCFGYVGDVVQAITQLVQHPAAVGSVFNLGSTEGNKYTGTGAADLSRSTGSSSEIHFVPYDQAYAPGFEDMRRRVPSIEKIQRLIGFRPSHTLDQILESVIAYESQLLS